MPTSVRRYRHTHPPTSTHTNSNTYKHFCLPSYLPTEVHLQKYIENETSVFMHERIQQPTYLDMHEDKQVRKCVPLHAGRWSFSGSD